MGVELGILVAVVLGGVLLGFLAVVTYNHVVGLQRRCERAWANIDVALKQRHDQLPNLVAAVQGQLGFEQQVLGEVTRLRAAYSPGASVHDQAALSEATSSAVRSLFALVEGYPELRSQQNVLALQEEIERLETLIARRRELFNEQVYRYNLSVTTLPGLILRPVFGWKTVESFSAEEPERVRPAASLSTP
ncbi:LemA family protein [soil metagenome]